MIERARKQLRDNGVWMDKEAALVCTSLVWSGGVYLDELDLVAHEDGYFIDQVPRELQARLKAEEENNHE